VFLKSCIGVTKLSAIFFHLPEVEKLGKQEKPYFGNGKFEICTFETKYYDIQGK
jgi:hypothetical protein